jgi:hypothetical protein
MAPSVSASRRAAGSLFANPGCSSRGTGNPSIANSRVASGAAGRNRVREIVAVRPLTLGSVVAAALSPSAQRSARRRSLLAAAVWALLAVWSVTGPSGFAHAEESSPVPSTPSISRGLPDGALLAGSAAGLHTTLERIQDSPFTEEWLATQAYADWKTSKDGRQFFAGVAIVESQLGIDVMTAVKRVLGGQLTWAVYPPAPGGKPELAAALEAADAEILELIRKKVEPFLLAAQAPVAMRQDGESWQLEFPDGARAVLAGKRIVFGSTASRFDAARAAVADGGLAALYPVAAPAAPQATEVTGYADLAGLRAVQNIERLLPSQMDNALASLLLGGVLEVLAIGESSAATLHIDDAGYSLSTAVDGGLSQLDQAHQAFFSKAADPAETEAFPIPFPVLTATIHRDWVQWYEHREDLLLAQLLPEFDKFETGLANILPGKDFAEDILARLAGPFSLVVAPQTYPHLKGTPGMKLPAVAVVMELSEPDRGGDVFQLFLQTVIAVANFEAQKQGRQPWILASQVHEGVSLSYAKPLEIPQGDQLPAIANLQPAGGQVGRHYVMATSLELCQQLVTALQEQTSASTEAGTPASACRPVGQRADGPPAGDKGAARDSARADDATADNATAGRLAADNRVRQNFHLRWYPETTAALLEANRDLLEARGLQDGKSIEQTQAELDLALRWIKSWRPLELQTRLTGGTVEVQLQGGWR